MVTKDEFMRMAAAHAEEMYDWYANLPTLSVAELVTDTKPTKTTVFCVDMINDFCTTGGALYSDRIAMIVPNVLDLLNLVSMAHTHRNPIYPWELIFVKEEHDMHAKEFACYPRHGVSGTWGARLIREFQKYMSPNTYTRTVGKNSLKASASLDPYYFPVPYETAIITGDCTNMCVRELAMHLRLWANEHQKDLRIIIPANCVQTFDMPSEAARAIEHENGLPQGAVKPHPGDFMHIQALYEMSRNGIEVVKEII